LTAGRHTAAQCHAISCVPQSTQKRVRRRCAAVDPTANGGNRERARRVFAAKREAPRRGDEVPQEERLTLGDLRDLRKNYTFKQNRSTGTMLSTFKHVETYFGECTKATRIGARIERYVADRRAERAA